MSIALRYLVALLAAFFAALPASAGVNVSFSNAQHYSDVDRFDELDEVTQVIEQHLRALGDRYLAPGQVLKIEVLDIDLAGRRDFVHSPPRFVRVVRDRADWPSIDLRYSLEVDGKVLASGEERVADMDYMLRVNRYPSHEPLRYEKRMLDNWFKERFVERKAEAAQRPAP